MADSVLKSLHYKLDHIKKNKARGNSDLPVVMVCVHPQAEEGRQQKLEDDTFCYNAREVHVEGPISFTWNPVKMAVCIKTRSRIQIDGQWLEPHETFVRVDGKWELP